MSRFEKEIEYGRTKHYLATFIIVDRIGYNRRIATMAKRIDGTIIQMSMSYWVLDVANKMKEKLGYEHELLKIPQDMIPDYISKKLNDAPIEDFIK